jgi:hypothetical protein
LHHFFVSDVFCCWELVIHKRDLSEAKDCRPSYERTGNCSLHCIARGKARPINGLNPLPPLPLPSLTYTITPHTHYTNQVDAHFWSQLISFGLVGVLAFTQVRGFLITIMKVSSKCTSIELDKKQERAEWTRLFIFSCVPPLLTLTTYTC